MTEGLHLQPIDRVRTHEEVIRRIQEEIFSGRLRPGDRLPTERQLGEMLGVSRASVREAIRVLETLEVVDVKKGPGPDSGLWVVTEPRGALTDMLRLHLALSHFSVADVVELRILLEVWIVHRAAEQRTEDQVTGLRSLVEQMVQSDTSMERFNELDTQFHIAIASCTDNTLVTHVMQALRGAIERRMLEGFHSLQDWPQTSMVLVEQHSAICDAIAARDSNLAAQLTQEHIQGFYQEIQ